MPCANHPRIVSGLASCAGCGHAFCGDCLVVLLGRPTCSGCKAETVRTLRSGAAADTDHTLAGSGMRLGARFLDFVLVFLPIYIPIMVHVVSPEVHRRIALRLAWFAGAIALLVLYEWLMLAWRGQTLGKLVYGVRVVRSDGARLGAGRALLRAASSTLMTIYYMPIVDGMFLFSRRRRTLHDRIAGTIVVLARRD